MFSSLGKLPSSALCGWFACHGMCNSDNICICSGSACGVVLWSEVSDCVCSFFDDAVSGRVASNGWLTGNM